MKNHAFDKFLLVTIILVCQGVCGAQTPAPLGSAQSVPAVTFSARTEMVLVPVIVTDHRGHVTGLTKGDFVIQESGAVQKIASFEEVKASAAPVQRVSGGTGGASQREFSNLRLSDFQPRRINIIVLDTINTDFFDQMRAKQEVVRFLASSVTTGDLTSLLVLSRSGVRIVHDFTTDSSVLIAALQKVKGEMDVMAGENRDAVAIDRSNHSQSPNVIDEASAFMNAFDNDVARAGVSGPDSLTALLNHIEHVEAQRVQQMQEYAIDVTLDGFEAIANAFSGIPGRKALIWISGSFPFRGDKPGDNVANRFHDRYQLFFHRLNTANIAIYPIDARGLVGAGFAASEPLRSASDRRINMTAILQSRLNQQSQSIDTLETFAGMTGGRAFYNTNDIGKAIARASEDSADYYVLGYYVKAHQGKPGWREIKVKVKRSGTQVRSRSGYFTLPDAAIGQDEIRSRDVAEALNSPFDFTALPITLQLVSEKQGEQGKKNVMFEIIIPPGYLEADESDQNHVNLQLVAIARDGTLRKAGETNQQLEAHLKPASLATLRAQGFVYPFSVPVPPGQYNVKVVIRDNVSGRIGSLSAPVSVR